MLELEFTIAKDIVKLEFSVTKDIAERNENIISNMTEFNVVNEVVESNVSNYTTDDPNPTHETDIDTKFPPLPPPLPPPGSSHWGVCVILITQPEYRQLDFFSQSRLNTSSTPPVEADGRSPEPYRT